MLVSAERSLESPSFEFLRQAAQRGHVDAEFELGLRYQGHTNVQSGQSQKPQLCDREFWEFQNLGKDQALHEFHQSKAACLFMRAAEQGHPAAQSALASCYGTGRGVSRDLEKAAELYTRAASQGFTEAQHKNLV